MLSGNLSVNGNYVAWWNIYHICIIRDASPGPVVALYSWEYFESPPNRGVFRVCEGRIEHDMKQGASRLNQLVLEAVDNAKRSLGLPVLTGQ